MYHRKAFTLIELLVVIAIISLLVAVLVPSMSNARQQATTVKCGAHIRQLGTGMTMYNHMHNAYPPHQWIQTDSKGIEIGRIRWFNNMAKLVGNMEVQSCPAVPDWEVGRNNSYGYNYKYLGSVRDNLKTRTRPFERFPVTMIMAPGATIAFADSDGTGWTKEYMQGVNDPDMLGNHGYTLDPTYIPESSLTTYSAGVLEPYAWQWYRTYISDRHNGLSNACFVDGHVDRITPARAYRDNSLWNGLGGQDPERDPHVPYKFKEGTTAKFRYQTE